MKRFYYGILLLICFLVIRDFFNRSHINQDKQIISSPPKNKLQQPTHSNDLTIHNNPPILLSRPMLSKRKIKHSVKGKAHSSLPDGFIFSENIFVIKANLYQSSMGKHLEERQGSIFFESQTRPLEAARVISDSSGKLYFVSSIIKLNDIDEARRQEILASGRQEYYYDSDQKLLFVESTQENLIEDLDQFQNRGYSAEFDYFRFTHQIR